MQYRLLTAAAAADLDATVNELLQRGWTLYEGPLMCAVPTDGARGSAGIALHYAQAMTLTAPTPAAAEAQAEVGELLERVGVSELTVPEPPAA